MGYIRQMGKAVLAACLPPSRFLVRGARAVNGTRPALSLTFDDGPHPVHTPRLLDRLAEYGIRGTFFVIGERVAAQPAIARRIVEEGHDIGNHTWSHGEPSTV